MCMLLFTSKILVEMKLFIDLCGVKIHNNALFG